MIFRFIENVSMIIIFQQPAKLSRKVNQPSPHSKNQSKYGTHQAKKDIGLKQKLIQKSTRDIIDI